MYNLRNDLVGNFLPRSGQKTCDNLPYRIFAKFLNLIKTSLTVKMTEAAHISLCTSQHIQKYIPSKNNNYIKRMHVKLIYNIKSKHF